MSRIVSWNLNERPPGNASVWKYLREDLGADVALVQEAVVPAGSRATYRPGGIAARDGARRPWGSAVVALSDWVEITPVGLAEGRWRGKGLGLAPLDCVSRGHVAIAQVSLSGVLVTLVSAYGLIEFGYASGTLLRTVADLEPLLDDPSIGENVILAGDWNIGTWWSEADAKFARREGAVMALLEGYGLVDCLDRGLPDDRGRLEGCTCTLGDRCRHIRTYKRAGKDSVYMDDYVYATEALASRITARVPSGWDWDSGLSDHAPLVVDIAS